MVEFDDLDINVKKKEELTAEAEKLAGETDMSQALNKATTLRKQWRRIHGSESLHEEELQARFDAALDVIYSKRSEIVDAAVKAKEEIIAKASELAKATNFNEANKKMNELMEQWKKTASAGKDKDDELWGSFKEARDGFYAARKQFYTELNEKFANAKSVKEELVAKAESLANSVEWKKTTELFNNMMEQWKAAGSAGRNDDDALWSKFSGARKQFNDAKNRYYAELRVSFEEKYQQKVALVEKAKELAASDKITRETTEAVKALRAEWKKVGSCGKEKEDAIWEQFNATVNSYFDKLKSVNDSKHDAWVNRMQSQIDGKKKDIEDAKRRIKRFLNDKATSIGERGIRDAEASIAAEEQYIAECEADIADLEAKLTK